ncbi:MAG TPA: DUF1588 domain-containing protein [Bdellovibrionales bacterium]|nr:DUF1588 domain-containing protein [Bdellovibrionales bacterium]
MKIALAGALGVSFAARTQASVRAPDQLNDHQFLNKLSRMIRAGRPPSPEEYESLEASRKNGATAAFFSKKIQEYLKSSAHADAMEFRLSELFELITPNLDKRVNPHNLFNQYNPNYLAFQEAGLEEARNRRDATVDLFRSLAAENLPWDRLLTAKKYNVYAPDGPTSLFSTYMFDNDFLSLARPDIKSLYGGMNFSFREIDSIISRRGSAPRTVVFPENDKRIAGAITTARFFLRYKNSATNKNRRRAAAIFKVFLCDPMIPEISNESKKFEIGALGFPVSHKELIARDALQDMHGRNTQCAACHQKLDPVGQTFLTSGIVLGSEPSPGALVFQKKDGTIARAPVAGLGELGAAIVKQAEYAECQVRHFWNWFVGTDVPLDEAKLTELRQSFERVGRRTNDFVAYLVQRPEFRTSPMTPMFSAETVQHLLRRCDNCHKDTNSRSEYQIAMYSGRQLTAEEIGEIRDRLKRPPGAKGKMPKNYTSWPHDDLKALLSWVEGLE